MRMKCADGVRGIWEGAPVPQALYRGVMVVEWKDDVRIPVSLLSFL
jgi:hypothetical protein